MVKRKLKKPFTKERKISRMPGRMPFTRPDIPVVCCITKLSMRTGEQNRIPLFIHNNTGASLGSSPSGQVYFTYQWRCISDNNLVRGYDTTYLRSPLPPGSSTKVSMYVVAPHSEGDYLLEVMMSCSLPEPVCEIAATITKEQMRIHAREYEIAVAEGCLDEAFTCYKKDQELLGNDLSEKNTLLCEVSTVKKWCTDNSLPYTVVQEARIQKDPCSKEIGSFHQQDIFGGGDGPEGYFAELRDVVIIGGHTLILADNNSTALYDAYLHPEKESIDFRQWDHIINDSATNAVLLTFEEEWGPDIEEGIFMNGVYADNYFHWLIEYIPRFWTLDQFDIDEKIPLIINSKLHPNLIEALEMCNSSRRPIIPIRDGIRYKVKKLLVPSSLSFIPPDRKRGLMTPPRNWWAISPFALHFVRKKFISGDRKNALDSGSRIYIHRKEGVYRKLMNEMEIEEIFKKYGFQSLDPAKISFREQINLFSSARIIAGPSGAGLVNMIFASDAANLLILSHKALFSSLAKYLGIDNVNILGTPIPETSFAENQKDYVVDIEKVEKNIQSLIGFSDMSLCDNPSNKPLPLHSHIPIGDIPVLSAATKYQVDKINGRLLHVYPPVIAIDKRQDIFIEGWAVDDLAGAPAATVFISFDSGQEYRAYYSLKRPDVAAHFRNENLLYSGFLAIVPAQSLPSGRRKCSMKIITHDRSHYYHYPDLISFEVNL